MTATAIMADEEVLQRAYAHADHEQRIRLSRVGCILALVLIPLFWGLDWIVYPALAPQFGLARGVSCLVVALIWILLGTAWGRQRIRVLGIAWALSPGVVISWMIAVSEGADSPYHAGLNLVMIIVTLLMPWTVIEVVALCSLTIGMYVVACGIAVGGKPLPLMPLVSNLYFMVSTAAICITAGVLSVRRRRIDFRLRHELDRRNRELREIDRLKGEFYANVSHELRTPLTLILAPLQALLAGAGLERRVRHDLRLMHGNALRLLRLINDILEVVRMDSGRLGLRKKHLDLAVWVPGIAQSARHLAHSKGLHFAVSGPSTPLIVDADPSRLEKVLLNLLSNAIKFTPNGGTVTVAWGLGERPWFEVRDTGIGIPVEEQTQLFRRFHQIDSSSTRQYRGLGLGLSLSRDLVEGHGGRLSVESAANAGACFRVELPPVISMADDRPTPTPTNTPSDLKTDTDPTPDDESTQDFFVQAYLDADRQDLVAAAAHEGSVVGQVIDPERATGMSDLVLIADDEPEMRTFLATLLRRQYRVVLASNGTQAVQLAHDLQPSLIILDLMMPQIDGMEACRRIRADEQACEARIILLTARADDDTMLSALQGGADDFLTKPFSSEEVLARAHNLLENAALQRSLRARNREIEDTLARLRQAEAHLVQSEKMNALGSLASGLLHEINNPLNYAQVALHLAREQVRDRASSGDEILHEMLTDAHDGMTRIGSVIGSLRTFAYPDHGDLTQPFRIAEAVDLAKQFTAQQCQGMVVTNQVDPDLQACGSLNQISMVLVNLITNACRAIAATTDGRTGEITIAARLRDITAEILVTDNGIGMDAERIQRIFEPFYTTSEPGQGMGLGLAICHTIVRNHRGRVHIHSEPGHGTTFGIELPIPALTAVPETAHG